VTFCVGAVVGDLLTSVVMILQGIPEADLAQREADVLAARHASWSLLIAEKLAEKRASQRRPTVDPLSVQGTGVRKTKPRRKTRQTIQPGLLD